MRGNDTVCGSLFSYVDLEKRRSAIDGRTTRHPGYDISLRIRKRIEQGFGWAKTVAGMRKPRHRGLPKVDWQVTVAMAADYLVRLPRLLGAVT